MKKRAEYGIVHGLHHPAGFVVRIVRAVGDGVDPARGHIVVVENPFGATDIQRGRPCGDRLVDLANAIQRRPDPCELDVLLAAGE